MEATNMTDEGISFDEIMRVAEKSTLVSEEKVTFFRKCLEEYKKCHYLAAIITENGSVIFNKKVEELLKMTKKEKKVVILDKIIVEFNAEANKINDCGKIEFHFKLVPSLSSNHFGLGLHVDEQFTTVKESILGKILEIPLGFFKLYSLIKIPVDNGYKLILEEGVAMPFFK